MFFFDQRLSVVLAQRLSFSCVPHPHRTWIVDKVTSSGY
jgi:hypothetical protein